ncbi:MAG: APC family permease [Acidobacteriota bacterium]|nr:APC family permease [Acidobacteriota bacterium]
MAETPDSGSPARRTTRLHKSLSTVEYFTFGFGSMIGVAWLILMDDWLGRGGPIGGALGFLIGGMLLLPIAHTYARLVRQIQDAGAEIAYTEGVFPPILSFATGWTMVLAYAIVCPFEAVAIGNLMARVFPELNSYQLWVLAGSPIYLPRLVIGLLLTALVVGINYRGIHPSGILQNWTTFGLLGAFLIFTVLGFLRGSAANLHPLFSHPGTAGIWMSILLTMQIVPYYMTGFESVAKGSEEAKAGFDPRNFGTAIYMALIGGFVFYAVVMIVVPWVYHPWQNIVTGHIGTEVAFERAFGAHWIAQVILIGAFLSLAKVFNGNFVASTRLLYGMGKRNLVHQSLSRVHSEHGTPMTAIVLMGIITAGAACLGDAILVPISDVGSLAVGVGWMSACLAYILRMRRAGNAEGFQPIAWLGVLVSLAIILMKVLPQVPGSFSKYEWLTFALWSGMGLLFWIGRPRPHGAERVG